jgi:hypothetical protein
MDRHASLVLDPARLVILFPRGAMMVASTSVPVLTRIALDLELSGDLVKQRFVQRLSDESVTEPHESRALGRGFAR